MDVSESNSSDKNLFQKNNFEDSDALKYIMSRRNMNSVSSNANKILELCSRQPTQFSMLNGSMITSSASSDTLNNVNGHNFTLSPTPLSTPHCATSFSSFPRFPNPVNHDDNGIHMRLNTNNILQPRINPATRRTRHFVPNERKDEYYWQKRRKNNEAARKSREKRRTIDSVLEEKVLILSHENKLLRNELYALKVKYGEIDADSNRDKEDSAVHSKKSGTRPYSLNHIARKPQTRGRRTYGLQSTGLPQWV